MSFLQVKHERENRNLALLCLVASGGITVGAPELQDDSALSSLCWLCRRKQIYRNALNCYCVISSNHKGERCFEGAAEKRKHGRQKNVLSKLWDVHTSTHHQLPQTKRGHLFSQAENYADGQERLKSAWNQVRTWICWKINEPSFIPRFPLLFSSLQPAAEIVHS